jgi:hypothetical protein
MVFLNNQHLETYMEATKPRRTTEVLLTLEDIVILERLVARAYFMTRHSVDQSYHTHLGHIADTLAEAAEEIDF